MKTELEIKDKTTDTEGIKIAPFRQHVRKTLPHKHNNYFEIIYLTKGSGSHTVRFAGQLSKCLCEKRNEC